MTREEHLAWCKKRALKYVDEGDLTSAWASMSADLQKHPDTKTHAGIELGALMLINGNLSTAPDMRKFIEGFN
jgi:hypothetical protein